MLNFEKPGLFIQELRVSALLMVTVCVTYSCHPYPDQHDCGPECQGRPPPEVAWEPKRETRQGNSHVGQAAREQSKILGAGTPRSALEEVPETWKGA